MRKVLVILLLLSIGCGGKNEIPEEYFTHLENGKRLLLQARYVEAGREMEKALRVYNGEEALYGLAISKTLSINDLMIMLVRTVAQGSSYIPMAEGERMMKEVEKTAGGLATQYMESAELWNNLLERYKKPVFEGDVPVYFATVPLLEFREELGRKEALFFSSMVNITAFILTLFYSQSLTADILGAYLFYRNHGGTRGFQLSRLIAYILTENRDLLTLRNGDLWKKSGEFLDKGVKDFYEFLGEEFETPSMQFKDGELLFKFFNSRSPSEEPQFGTFKVTIPSPLTSSVMGGKIYLEDGFLQTISVYLGILIKFLAPSLKTFLGSYANYLDFIEPSLLVQTIETVIPEKSLAFDFKSFFSSPDSMRYFFPVTRGVSNIFENDLYLEWECDDLDSHGYPGGVAGLICEKNSSLTDSEHFAGGFKIAKDGILSRAPYMLFADPSINGLLYLNGSKFSDILPEGLKKSDLLLLNAFLGYAVNKILSVIGY